MLEEDLGRVEKKKNLSVLTLISELLKKTAFESKRAGRKALRRDGTPEVALILLHVIILTPAATKRQTLDSKLLD